MKQFCLILCALALCAITAGAANVNYQISISGPLDSVWTKRIYKVSGTVVDSFCFRETSTGSGWVGVDTTVVNLSDSLYTYKWRYYWGAWRGRTIAQRSQNWAETVDGGYSKYLSSGRAIHDSTVAASTLYSGVWANATRTLSDYSGVWSVTTRRLSDTVGIGSLIPGVWGNGTRTLTAATNLGFPTNFSSLGISTAGKVYLTDTQHVGIDWAKIINPTGTYPSVNLYSWAGTGNAVSTSMIGYLTQIAKTTNITGFNDITEASIWAGTDINAVDTGTNPTYNSAWIKKIYAKAGSGSGTAGLNWPTDSLRIYSAAVAAINNNTVNSTQLIHNIFQYKFDSTANSFDSTRSLAGTGAVRFGDFLTRWYGRKFYGIGTYATDSIGIYKAVADAITNGTVSASTLYSGVWGNSTRTLTANTNLGMPSGFSLLAIDGAGRVTVGTNVDKTAYTLSTAGVAGVWQADLSGYSTANQAGTLLKYSGTAANFATTGDIWHYRIDTISAPGTGDQAGYHLYGIATGATSSNWTNAQRDSALMLVRAGMTDTGLVSRVWSKPSTRTLTAGTNIVLAKGTGITGFNDLDASAIGTAVWTTPATRTLAGAQSWNLTGNITGNLSGSVGSVTGSVGSVTGNVGGNVTGSVGSVNSAVTTSTADKNALVDLAWDEPRSGHTTSGTFGYYLDAQVSLAGGTSGGWSAAEKDSMLTGSWRNNGADANIWVNHIGIDWNNISNKTATVGLTNTTLAPVTLAATQSLYAPAKAGDAMSLTGDLTATMKTSVQTAATAATPTAAGILNVTFPANFSQLAIQDGTGWTWSVNSGGGSGQYFADTLTILMAKADSLRDALAHVDSMIATVQDTLDNDSSTLRNSSAAGLSPSDSATFREWVWGAQQSLYNATGTFGSLLDKKVSSIAGLSGNGAFTRYIVVVDTSANPDVVVGAVKVMVTNINEDLSDPPQPTTDNNGIAVANLDAGTWVEFISDTRYLYNRKTVTISGGGTDTLKVAKDLGNGTTVPIAWQINRSGSSPSTAYGYAYPKIDVQLVSVNDSMLYVGDTNITSNGSTKIPGQGNYGGAIVLRLYPNALFTNDSTYYTARVYDSRSNIVIERYKFRVPVSDTLLQSSQLPRWK